MAYIICSNCGAKALIVASRCPSCQHPFPSREERERTSAPVRKQSGAKAPWYIAGLVVLMGAGTWVAWSAQRKADADRKAAAAQIVPPEPVPDTTRAVVAPVVADSVVVAPQVAPQVAAAPQPAPRSATPSATVNAATTKRVPRMPAGDELPPPAATSPGPPPKDVNWERAVTITAVNVRERPDRASKALLVLVPDDVVLLGDAITGWRRIRVDGMTGWVDPRHFELRARKR